MHYVFGLGIGYLVAHAPDPLPIFLTLLAIVALHEALHYVACRLLGLRTLCFAAKRTLFGIAIGLVVEYDDPKRFAIATLAPQIITVALLCLAPLDSTAIVLALAHLLVSGYDLAKVVETVKNGMWREGG